MSPVPYVAVASGLSLRPLFGPFRRRIPTATLLAVSDKPLHAEPKLSAAAQSFYEASRRQHVEIAISVADRVRRLYPDGLPAADLRSADEPLLGTADPQPAQPQP